MPPEKIHARNEKGQPICGAKTRGTGDPCKTTQVMRNGRCRLHGGKTPIGPAAGSFKHGKYSKAFILANSKGMGELYDSLMKNAEYIELRNEIAVLDARIFKLIEQSDLKGSGELIRQLREQFNLMRSFLRKDNAAGANAAVVSMSEIFDASYAETLTWGEIANLFELRRRLVKEERERLIAAQAMVTGDELRGFMIRVGNILSQRIKDRRLLSEIAGDLRTIQVTQAAAAEVIEV